MSFEFTATPGAEILPPGQYVMRFAGVEPQAAKPGGEPFLKWKWDRQAPDGTLLRWTSMSSQRCSEGSKARTWLEGMFGRVFTDGEKVHPDQLEGHWFHVLVIAKTKNNGTIGDDIANVWPYQAAAQQPAPARPAPAPAAPSPRPSPAPAGQAAVAAVRGARPAAATDAAPQAYSEEDVPF